jgi:hypothetical protein
LIIANVSGIDRADRQDQPGINNLNLTGWMLKRHRFSFGIGVCEFGMTHVQFSPVHQYQGEGLERSLHEELSERLRGHRYTPVGFPVASATPEGSAKNFSERILSTTMLSNRSGDECVTNRLVGENVKDPALSTRNSRPSSSTKLNGLNGYASRAARISSMSITTSY